MSKKPNGNTHSKSDNKSNKDKSKEQRKNPIKGPKIKGKNFTGAKKFKLSQKELEILRGKERSRKGVKEASNAEKAVPNPYGKRGGPAHQGKIQDIAADLRSQGYDISFEEYVKTPGGNKSTRYGDMLVENSETGERWIVQVGKQTKAGNPISRENKAIQDLESAGWKVEFVPYN